MLHISPIMGRKIFSKNAETQKTATTNDEKQCEADAFQKIALKLNMLTKDQAQDLLNLSISILKEDGENTSNKKKELRSRIESYGVIIDDKNDLIPLLDYENIFSFRNIYSFFSSFVFFDSSFELAKQDQQFIFWLWIQTTETEHDFISFKEFIHDNGLFLEETSNLFREPYFQELISNYQKIFNAIEEKNASSVIRILKKNPELLNLKNKFGQTPLHLATEKNIAEIVQFLLGLPRINVTIEDNKYQDTLLHTAAKNGHFEIMKLLLPLLGMDVNKTNKDDRTPLWCAVEKGHTDVARFLLEQPGINVTIEDDRHKDTLLHTAAKNGHFEIMELLLSLPGIDVNKKNRDGCTPLWCAVEKGQTEAARLLLEHPEIDVNETNKYGNTPLHEAAYKMLWHPTEPRYTETLRLLLSLTDVNVNKTNRDYDTPLHAVAEDIILLFASGKEVSPHVKERYIILLKLLLYRIDTYVNKKNKQGDTLLRLAAKKGLTEIIKLLVSSGKLHGDQKNSYAVIFWGSDSAREFFEEYNTKYKNFLKDPFDHNNLNQIASFINELRKKYHMASLSTSTIRFLLLLE